MEAHTEQEPAGHHKALSSQTASFFVLWVKSKAFEVGLSKVSNKMKKAQLLLYFSDAYSCPNFQLTFHGNS